MNRQDLFLLFNKYKLYTTNLYVEMLTFSYSIRFNAVLSHVNVADIRHKRSSPIFIPFF